MCFVQTPHGQSIHPLYSLLAGQRNMFSYRLSSASKSAMGDVQLIKVP